MKNNLNRFEVGAVGALLSIVLCALFSYPLHTTSVLVNTIFFLAILSNRLPAKLFIRLNRPGSIAFLCFFLVLSTGFSFKEWRRMQALKNWEVAAHIALVDGFSKADIYYNSAVDELFNEGVFLYNYGAEAYVADRYEQSLILLQRAILFHSSGDLYVYLGDLLRTLKQYSSAEAAYKVAENIQPSRFLPKIQLLNLYQQKGEKEKGLRQARVIIDFPVKIPSPTADEYKKMAHDFLEKENVR